MAFAYFSRILRISSLAGFVLFGASFAIPRLASAGAITFEVPTITVTQSNVDQQGYFDVVVFQTGGGSSLFQFEADVQLNPGTSNLSFQNADIATSVPYVFTGNSGDQSGPTPPYPYTSANNLPYPNTTDGPNAPSLEVENSDTPLTNVGVALSSTELGLMRILYDVPANSPIGSYAMTFTQNTAGYDYVETTSYSSANYFLPSVINGAINVVTPEPGSVVMIALGAIGLIGLGLRRARRA